MRFAGVGALLNISYKFADRWDRRRTSEAAKETAETLAAIYGAYDQISTNWESRKSKH